jgi:phosphinothricin acetyltransferase
LRPDATGKGLGTQLYLELLKELKDRSLHTVMGGIALPNDASVALHEKLGFSKVAQFRQVGHKFGNWIDVGYWQLLFDPR